MGRTDAFEQGSLQSRRLIKLLMLQNAQGLAHDLTLISIATGMNEPLN